MGMKPTVARGLDPVVIAGTVKAAQQQQFGPHHATPPSHLNRILTLAIWLAFIGSMAAVFYKH